MSSNCDVFSCVALTLGVFHETGTKTTPAKAAKLEKRTEDYWYLRLLNVVQF